MATRKNGWRIITATTLFDGHDASINIIRRLLQQRGCEVIHLGFNRSVEEVVDAALQEDADAIAISSYQGGHVEYLQYLLQTLASHNAENIQIFCGGGATITADEARQLEQQGVNRIYDADDGARLGLNGIIDDLLKRLQQYQDANTAQAAAATPTKNALSLDNNAIGKILTSLQRGEVQPASLGAATANTPKSSGFIIGVTGTGGSGKSTFIDECLTAWLTLYPQISIAYLAIDPGQYQSTGALLGDRMRINSLPNKRLFMRSIALKHKEHSLPQELSAMTQFLRCHFPLIIIETAGIGQHDSSIREHVDLCLYIMNKDYGAATQLEKIAMLQCADAVVLNKAEQPGSEDAQAHIEQQLSYNHAKNSPPLFAISASHHKDKGLIDCLKFLCSKLPKSIRRDEKDIDKLLGVASACPEMASTAISTLLNSDYLQRIGRQAKQREQTQQQQLENVNKAHAMYQSLLLCNKKMPAFLQKVQQSETALATHATEFDFLVRRYNEAASSISDETTELMQSWHSKANNDECSSSDTSASPFPTSTHTETLSGLAIPHIASGEFQHPAQLLQFMQRENYPGVYPYTAGVFTHRHDGEEPARMFAGFATPEQTNRRFHYLLRDQNSIRLSTAFDPNTLYGSDPTTQPDNYGCIGMSGVSIATLDDMKKLYSGIDLCDAATSVSMTINGPAPTFMAWLLITATDQQIEKWLQQQGLWHKAEESMAAYFDEQQTGQPGYHGQLPQRHNGLGLGLLGISGQRLLRRLHLLQHYEEIQQHCYDSLRGTLQADILKEEISQNECIFSVDFALSLMADLQSYFIAAGIKRFYSISVSGYHIGEAGANPVTQLAFTLANGFSYVEYFLAKGMAIDDIAPQISFFFSNGMDAEYAVIGRVARRIWAQTMKEVYGANQRSQKLKYHIQTSGRSLQAKAIDLNDIRTSMQALYAINDGCNSLHTNAYDEAVTTPTESSVYRAMAIQMIIQRELGISHNHNPLQGSFLIQSLTEQVEQAVYQEFEKLALRGGVLGAIGSGYQRLQIQRQSLKYEQAKHDGKLAVIGVNQFHSPQEDATQSPPHTRELIRCNDKQKQQRLTDIDAFKQLHRTTSPQALKDYIQALQAGHNSFEQLLQIAPDCTLGEISTAMYNAGGKYRRSM